MPTPEERARQQIDATLIAAGRTIQNFRELNLAAGNGIALCEVPLKSGSCDYLLLVDRKPIGVIEAKKVGTRLSGAASSQSTTAKTFQTSSLPPALFRSTMNQRAQRPSSATNVTHIRDRVRFLLSINPKRSPSC